MWMADSKRRMARGRSRYSSARTAILAGVGNRGAIRHFAGKSSGLLQGRGGCLLEAALIFSRQDAGSFAACKIGGLNCRLAGDEMGRGSSMMAHRCAWAEGDPLLRAYHDEE